MSRLTLITLIICSVCILGGSFGNGVFAQNCISSKTITGFGTFTDLYTPCHPWMRVVFQFDLASNEEEMREGTCMFAGGQDHSEQAIREYYAYQYNHECQTVSEQFLINCSDLKNHRLQIDDFDDAPNPPSKDCYIANPRITVNYLLSQPN